MADVNYIITIKSEGEAPKEKKVASTQTGDRVDKPDSQNGFDSFMKTANTIRKSAPVGYALRYADLAITTKINRVELRTGSSTLQERIDFNYSMGKKLAASGAAIIGGLATQNYLVAAAGVMSLVSTGVNYAIAAENLAIASSVENIGIQMANIRAGANGGRNGNS